MYLTTYNNVCKGVTTPCYQAGHWEDINVGFNRLIKNGS